MASHGLQNGFSSIEKTAKLCRSLSPQSRNCGQKRESSIARRLSNGKYFYLEDLTSAAVTRISQAQTAEGNKAVSSAVVDDRLHLLTEQLPEEIREMVFKDNGFSLLNDALAGYPFEEAMQHIAAFEQVAAIYSKLRFKALRDELFPVTMDSKESTVFYGGKYTGGSEDKDSSDIGNNNPTLESSQTNGEVVDLDSSEEAVEKVLLSVTA